MVKSKLERLHISEEQHIRLLEMCNTFYPDYQFLNKSMENQMYVSFRKYSTLDKVEVIPWFELCLTHLSVKIGEKINKSPYYLVESWLYSRKEHLVDYLFDLFKK